MPQKEQAWAGHSSGIEFVDDLSESSSESDLWFSYNIDKFIKFALVFFVFVCP